MIKHIYYFLLDSYCEGLEEWGVVVRWKLCLVLFMHLPSFTVEYGTWHLCCWVEGLDKEWLTGSRGLWRWQPLASWQYHAFRNPVSAPSYTLSKRRRASLGSWGFEVLVSIHATSVFCGSSSWCRVSMGRWSSTTSLKEWLCLHLRNAPPAVSMFRLEWVVHLLFCSLTPSLKNKLAELQEDKREGWG